MQDELATLDKGIMPKDITSTNTPAKHVGDYRNKTSYNSTSVNMAETIRQSNKSGNPIVEIDLNKLPDNQVIVDLSRNDAERRVRLASNEPELTAKAVYFAGNSSEVLIKGNISSDAVRLLSPEEVKAIMSTPKQQETIANDKKAKKNRKCPF